MSRTVRSAARAGAVLGIVAALALGGCRNGSGDEKFPQLKDIPEEAEGLSTPAEREAVVDRLERVRRGESVAPTGIPAVPPKKPEPGGEKAKAVEPHAALSGGARRPKGFIVAPPAAQSSGGGLIFAGLSLRGSQSADGAARPVAGDGITGAVQRPPEGSGVAMVLSFVGASADLRDGDRARVLNAAASHVARGGAGAMIVAGGKDGTALLGGFSLGLKRASAVADLLVGAGLKAEAITVAVSGDRQAADQVPAPYLQLAEDGAVVVLR